MKNGEKKCSVVRGKASCDYPPVCKEKGRKRRNTLLEMASLPVYSSPNHSSSHIHKHNQDSYSYGQSHSQKNGYSHQTVAEVPHAPSFHAETAGASSLADFLSPSLNPPPQYVGFGDTGSSATHFSHENDSHRITRTSPSLLNVSKLIPESDLLEGSLSQTSVNCHHHRRRLRRRRQRCTAFENARREMEMGMGESNYFSEDAEGEALDVNCSSSQFSYYKRIKDSEAHSLSERKRRKRINEKMRALQELIPNSNKTDKASMLDEAIEYLKMLQMQIQSMAIGNGLMMSLMTPYIQMPIFNPLMHIEYMALARPWVESSIGCSVFQGNVNWAPFGMSPMMSFLNPVHASPPSSTLPVPSSVPTNFTKNPLFRLPRG